MLIEYGPIKTVYSIYKSFVGSLVSSNKCVPHLEKEYKQFLTAQDRSLEWNFRQHVISLIQIAILWFLLELKIKPKVPRVIIITKSHDLYSHPFIIAELPVPVAETMVVTVKSHQTKITTQWSVQNVVAHAHMSSLRHDLLNVLNVITYLSLLVKSIVENCQKNN